MLKFWVNFFFLQRVEEHKEREQQAEGEGEAGSPLSREPDVGLNPRTLEIMT